MGNALGICPCASMDLCWGFSLGSPWMSSMGKSVCVPMWITWTCIGSSQWAIHGCAIWVVHWECPYGPSMELHWGIHGILLWVVHWAFAHVHLWICTGASHWAFH